MKIINVPQRTPEWHQWRNAGASASEAVILLKRSPYKTPYRLYQEKTGLILPAFLDGNPHVRRGIAMESVARASFERRHGTLLLPMCAESDQYPFLKASFDGIDDNGIPVELKAPTEQNFRAIERLGNQSELYQYYLPQVQQQMLVADTDTGWLSFYLNEDETLDFEIARDPILLDELVFEAKQFVQGLMTLKPPAKDPRRDIFIPDGAEQDHWERLAAFYHLLDDAIASLKVKIQEHEREQAALERQFIALMGDFAEAEAAGVRVNRYLQQGSIDYKAALFAICPTLDPVALESYRKPAVERRRFTTKEQAKSQVPYSREYIMKKGAELSIGF